MKAKIQENGSLLYLPNIYAGWDNFKNAGKNLHELHGFYDVVQPNLTSEQYFGVPYYAAINNVITFEVIDIIEKPKDKEYYKMMFDVLIAEKKLFKYFGTKILTDEGFAGQSGPVIRLL